MGLGGGGGGGGMYMASTWYKADAAWIMATIQLVLSCSFAGVEDGQTVRMPVGSQEVFITFKVNLLILRCWGGAGWGWGAAKVERVWPMVLYCWRKKEKLVGGKGLQHLVSVHLSGME